MTACAVVAKFKCGTQAFLLRVIVKVAKADLHLAMFGRKLIYKEKTFTTLVPIMSQNSASLYVLMILYKARKSKLHPTWKRIY
jgi:hypothetical protein